MLKAIQLKEIACQDPSALVEEVWIWPWKQLRSSNYFKLENYIRWLHSMRWKKPKSVKNFKVKQ